jgi:hypothetical protein
MINCKEQNLLKNLTATQVKFSAFYGTRRFVTVLIKTPHSYKLYEVSIKLPAFLTSTAEVRQNVVMVRTQRQNGRTHTGFTKTQ